MVTDTLTRNRYGLLMLNHKDLMEIKSRTGQLSNKNEYQVHFYTLNFRCWLDNEFIDIAIPTAYYNYPQEVSSAAIDFDLRDVISVSNQIEPLAIAKETELINVFSKYLSNKFDKVEMLRESMNNFHRHPGKMHSFSGTDYDKSRKNPGICFPFESANETPIFSGIMTLNELELGHLEYRVATGNTNNMTYEEGFCYKFVKGYVEERSNMQKFLNIQPVIVKNDSDYPSSLDTIVDAFNKLDYEPSYDAILSENVKEKSYKKSYTTNKKDTKQQTLSYWEDDVLIHKKQKTIWDYTEEEDMNEDEDENEIFVLDDDFYGQLTLGDIDIMIEDLVEIYGADEMKVVELEPEQVVKLMKEIEGVNDGKYN